MNESVSEPVALEPAAPRRNRIPRIAVLCVGLLVGCCAVVLARDYQRPAPRTDAAKEMSVGSASVGLGVGAPQWSAIEVAPAAAGTPQWSDAVPARIVFDETRTSRIGTPLGGRVTAVSVERGEHVKAGQPLFTVVSPDLAGLRSDRAKADVEHASAQIAFDRTQALVDGQALPGKELLAAKEQLAEAELAVKVAAQKLAALHVTANGDTSFTVTAPRDGVIVEKNLAVGQEVDPSAGSLLAVADLGTVWVVADLFENDLGKLAVGAQARVVLGDGKEVAATVDHVSSIIDPDRHSIPVRVKLDNASGALRPNAHVQLRFLESQAAAVELPASAVMSDGDASYVYVRDGNLLRRQTVTAGAARSGKVAVIAGLTPGQPVVTRGATLLDNQIQLDN